VRVYRRSQRYNRGLRSGMWHHVNELIFWDTSTPENETATLSLDVGHQSPNDAVPHSRREETR
jgi:hypothetical protein